MASLERTAAALADLAASERYMFGLHDTEEPKAGALGRDIGEVPYDPARHDPAAINPLSIWEHILEIPHVKLAIPNHPLAVNVAVHQDTRDRSDPRITAMKFRQARALQADIGDAQPDSNNRVTNFILSEGDPLANAKIVAQLSRQALTFVISDFRRLPLEAVRGIDYSSIVAIKANHITERELRPGIGSITLGGVREVNTDKPRELASFNTELSEKHRQTVARLQATGLAVAAAIFRGNFDSRTADAEIAQAIRSLKTQA